MIWLLVQSFWLSGSLATVFQCPSAAEYGWVTGAGSPSREAARWDTRMSVRSAAEYMALRRCVSSNEPPTASSWLRGPKIVVVAWDADEPLNHPYGAAAILPQPRSRPVQPVVRQRPSVRCSYQSQIA